MGETDMRAASAVLLWGGIMGVVAGAAAQTPAVLYTQDFEAGQGGWTINNNTSPQPGDWRYSSGCAASSGDHSVPFAFQYTDTFCGYRFGESEGRVTSPAISLVGYGEPFTLSFNYRLRSEDPVFEWASVWVSGNGSTYTLVAENLPRPGVTGLGDPSGWSAVSIDISSLVTTQAFVIFQFHGSQIFGDGTGFYFDDVEIAGIPEVNTAEIWVDFAYSGTELGSEAHPFNTLIEGAEAVDAGGVVKVRTGASPETLTIAKAMRIDAVGGTVRVGSAVKAAGASIVKNSSDGGTILSPLALPPAGALTLDVAALAEYRRAPERAAIWSAPASDAMTDPALVLEDGMISASPEDVLSVRLVSPRPIQPETVWHTVLAAPEQAAEVSWTPARPGDLTDIWIRCKPLPAWQPGDIVSVTAGADIADDAVLPPVTWHFRIEE